MTVIYFAYGSNMSSAQLCGRGLSPTVRGIGWLAGKALVCNKRSVDGSGKANLIDSSTDVVWGVLYELAEADLARLDSFEGGYERQVLPVQLADGTTIQAVTYVSRKLTSEAVPYDWYKALLVAGAREHGLPDAYIAFLERLPAKADERKRA